MIKTIDRSALVWFSAQRMYDLVNDIHAYPQFLPWCAEARILEQDPEWVVACLSVAKGGLRHQFTTRNSLAMPGEIRMELVDGPFRHLQGRWRFLELDTEACKVELNLSFELNGKLAGMALGPIFGQAANTMVDAFCNRARQVYGNAAPGVGVG